MINELINNRMNERINKFIFIFFQHCKMRGGGKEQKKVSGSDRKYTLTTDDLGTVQ